MTSIKCICNGSQGTDCYYCGGSGEITEAFHILGSLPKQVLHMPKYNPIAVCNLYLPKIDFLKEKVDRINKKSKESYLQELSKLIANLGDQVFNLKKRLPLNEINNYASIFDSLTILEAKFNVKSHRIRLKHNLNSK